jgi:hypothetical protein
MPAARAVDVGRVAGRDGRTARAKTELPAIADAEAGGDAGPVSDFIAGGTGQVPVGAAGRRRGDPGRCVAAGPIELRAGIERATREGHVAGGTGRHAAHTGVRRSHEGARRARRDAPAGRGNAATCVGRRNDAARPGTSQPTGECTCVPAARGTAACRRRRSFLRVARPDKQDRERQEQAQQHEAQHPLLRGCAGRRLIPDSGTSHPGVSVSERRAGLLSFLELAR